MPDLEPPVESRQPRDAIIWIPGPGTVVGTSLHAIGRRLAVALDNAALPQVQFRLAEERKTADTDGASHVITLMRRDKDQEQAVLDLYEFNYRDFLLRDLDHQTPFRQVLSIAQTIASNTFNLVAALSKPSLRRDQKRQVYFGASLFGVLALYLVLLIAALSGTVVDVFETKPGATAPASSSAPVSSSSAHARTPLVAPPFATPATAPSVPATPVVSAEMARGAHRRGHHGAGGFRSSLHSTYAALKSFGGWWVAHWRAGLGALKTGIVVLTLLGLTVRFNLKDALGKIAPTLACTSNYLTVGARRNQITGELLRLLDYLDEQTAAPYRKVHVLSYSFGSVITLDALFSPESAPSKRLKRLDTLVTIGCPFDFVRTYWPNYFKGRQALDDTPKRWINIYSHADVLGSNFVDENPKGGGHVRGIDVGGAEPRRPTEGDNLAFGPRKEDVTTISEQLRFIGFRSHSMYWDLDSENAVSCFAQVVDKLYPDGVISAS